MLPVHNKKFDNPFYFHVNDQNLPMLIFIYQKSVKNVTNEGLIILM